MKKIYLAGFDVFYPDSAERGERMKDLCAEYGFIGLYPLDNHCETAEEIFEANTAMIRDCDIIAANMNSFRGFEPDSGTCFELGYAFALGKKLYCYTEDSRTLRDKIGAQDKEGFTVEDFGFPINLMMAVPSEIINRDFETCLKRISESE